jgi:hypothetical protein
MFALAASAGAQTASELPITRVALYKNGVGFFEHAGQVTGDQSVSIDFTSAQLNDVLQSLTAIDLNGGRISGAGYNSTTPLEEQLKTLPLALDANPSDADFYNAVRGARIQVSAPEATIVGRLLSIDVRNSTEKEATTQHRFVTVISDSGQVRTFELTAATSVTLLDASLHTDVTRYLELLASTRSQGLRHLTLLDRGTGARELRVSYISEVPVWKSTYRILFTDDNQAKIPTATLQGWSVVDNTTGSDWNNVHLDLIAGAPQSFIQPLSMPIYARRPEIAIAGQVQLAPQTHDSGEVAGNARTAVQGFVTDPTGAVIPNARVTVTNAATGAQVTRNTTFDGRFLAPVAQPGQYNVEISAPGFAGYMQRNVYVGDRQAANLNARLNVGSASETIEVTASDQMLNTESAMVSSLPYGGRSARPRAAKAAPAATTPMPAPPPPPVANYAEAAQASLTPQTSTSAFDDFFEYTLTDPITIRKNESALVPILQTKLPIERVTLWSQHEPVALRALWVTNSSTLTLDRGSFSIVENGSFGGEGLLDPIHPGERRLLSYAADQAVHVDNAAGPQEHHLRSIVIAKGILTEHYRDIVERDYGIRNAAPEARTVVIEHNKMQGYQLNPLTTQKPDETLPNAYRFRVVVPAGATAHLKVAESHAYQQGIQVGNINEQQIKVLITEMGKQAGEEPALLKQLQPILDAQRAVSDLRAKKNALDNQLNGLRSEEERQRANIVALKDTDKLAQKRFVDELGRIEDQILDLQKQQKTLDTQLEAAQQDLANKVQTLQFDQTLEP